jgi:hypothetical protein
MSRCYICRIRMVMFYIPYVFFLPDLEITSGLAYIPFITCVAFQIPLLSCLFSRILHIVLVALCEICKLVCLKRFATFTYYSPLVRKIMLI